MKKNKDNGGTAVAEVTLTSQAPSGKSQNSASEQPVSETDYLELSRLVIEYTSRVDNGRAHTLWWPGQTREQHCRGMWARITIVSYALNRGGNWLPENGWNCSRGAML